MVLCLHENPAGVASWHAYARILVAPRNPAPQVQEGNTRRQIMAIRAFLSQGKDAGIPAGIRTKETDQYKLVPGQDPIVFRTFMKNVGTHAITVGYPVNTNVAFDALGVRLARAWQGDFLSAKSAWHARGGQFASIPGSNVISFPPAPAFAKLKNPDADWPEYHPKKKKQEPKKFQFKGYELTKNRIPIFHYRFHSLRISDQPVGRISVDRAHLERKIQMTSPSPVENVWFRVFVSPGIKTTSENTFRTKSGIEITIQNSSNTNPIVRDNGKNNELLVPIELKKTVRTRSQWIYTST